MAPDAGPALSPQARALDAALPQTQCTRCGYADCHAYAVAMADAGEAINRCPPGGAEGVARLAALTGRAAQAIDPACGHEGPRTLAVIDEAWCIGCTLCIKACPVDCIAMVPVTGERTGWQAWSTAQADDARARYAFHRMRVERDRRENDERLAAKAAAKLADLPAHTQHTDPEVIERKRAVVEAALARARAKREGQPP